ncbi:MAG TPA: YtxH domain-containing protein [Candidatus Eisenbacteria bacterium]|jgi:gas vesicle protein|nr:YtxH domain-containing protein [Candidatus Eisenbacteria bacterium]
MNENPYINDVSRSGSAGMSGFLLGAIVGAGVALLFAPATGTDTRRRVGDTVKKLGNAAKDRIQEGRDQIRDRMERGSQNSESGRQGFETGRSGSQGMESRSGGEQFSQGRREPVPSTGSPGQTGSRTTPGKTPQGSTYTP